MANFFLSCSMALVLIFFFSRVNGCSIAVIGGGCPDPKACIETCRPCERGIGRIKAFCRPAGGGFPYDQCICDFLQGAPCNPPGCPKRPPYLNATIIH